MFNIGSQELLVIFLVVLLLFGANRIPEIARAFGQGMRDLKKAVAGIEDELKVELEDRPKRPTERRKPALAPTNAASDDGAPAERPRGWVGSPASASRRGAGQVAPSEPEPSEASGSKAGCPSETAPVTRSVSSSNDPSAEPR